MSTRPTIGRIVQWLRPIDGPEPAAQPVAAIVTGVFASGDGGDIVTLTVFEPGRTPRPLPEAVLEGERPGSWRWPPVSHSPLVASR